MPQHVGSRAHAMDVRPGPHGHRSLVDQEIRQPRDAGPVQHSRPRRRPCLRRNGRAVGQSRRLPRQGRGSPFRGVPDHHRDRSPRVGPGVRPPVGRSGPAGLRLLPHHPGLTRVARAGDDARTGRLYFPGRGRNRSHLLGDRGLVRRRIGRHIVVRPRHRAQDRGDRPGGQRRTSAGDPQHPAGGAVHRLAHQDRAVRPVPGRLRSEW